MEDFKGDRSNQEEVVFQEEEEVLQEGTILEEAVAFKVVNQDN